MIGLVKIFTYNPETGETAPTTIDVAKKLERAAVWDDKQIEERIKTTMMEFLANGCRKHLNYSIWFLK